MSEIILYNNGELELTVSLDKETVWLNRNQLSELFDRDIKTIGKHISNVFKDKELDKISTVAKIATVQFEGGRKVLRKIEHYNLDVIISVGYRVKSQKGVHFRQWATSILKQYISNGFVINQEKVTQKRLLNLEEDIKSIKSHIKKNTLELKEGIFFDGQIFDAYSFITDLIKNAKSNIYIDEKHTYLIGANIKDAGKKTFAFCKMNIQLKDIIK